VQLALSGFLFEDDYQTQSVNFSRFCEVARAAGYQCVELRDTQISLETGTAERTRLLQAVLDAELAVSCLTARGLPGSGAERDEFFLRYLDLCRDMKCGLLKIESDTAWLNLAAGQAQNYGVTLARNNHINGRLETVLGTWEYLREIAHPNFGLLYDSLHLCVNGEDYLGCIPEFAAVTRNILVHSRRLAGRGEQAVMDFKGSRWSHALPDDTGAQDWPGIFRRFRQSGYDGLITVIESGWPKERREEIAFRCAEILRRLWEAAVHDGGC